MEYPCHRCGAAVEQGTAFCPQCNAPQIRVAVAETVPPSGSVSESSIPPLPAYFGSSLATRIDWSQAWPATALAGLIAAVLMITPFAGLGLGMLIGGSLSVVFYRRRVPAARLTPGMGARLGMVTGVLGSVCLAIVLAIRTLLTHGWDSVREDLITGVEQAAARNPDPANPPGRGISQISSRHRLAAYHGPDHDRDLLCNLLRIGRRPGRGPASSPQGTTLACTRSGRWSLALGRWPRSKYPSC